MSHDLKVFVYFECERQFESCIEAICLCKSLRRLFISPVPPIYFQTKNLIRLAENLPALKEFVSFDYVWTPEEILSFIERADKLHTFVDLGSRFYLTDMTEFDVEFGRKLCAIVGRRERNDRKLDISIVHNHKFVIFGSNIVQR